SILAVCLVVCTTPCTTSPARASLCDIHTEVINARSRGAALAVVPTTTATNATTYFIALERNGTPKSLSEAVSTYLQAYCQLRAAVLDDAKAESNRVENDLVVTGYRREKDDTNRMPLLAWRRRSHYVQVLLGPV